MVPVSENGGGGLLMDMFSLFPVFSYWCLKDLDCVCVCVCLGLSFGFALFIHLFKLLYPVFPWGLRQLTMIISNMFS